MADYVALRTAIVAALEGIDGIGEVHAYRRLVLDATAAAAAFSEDAGDGTRYVRFADVDLASGRLDPLGWGDGTDYLLGGPLAFTVRLYRGLKDADETGTAFADMVWDALLALSGVMRATTPRRERIAVVLIENSHRMFAFPGLGDVLCHYGEIRIECPTETVV
jgi:hypothetical protein